MKTFRLITLIILMVSSIVMAFVAPYHVSEWQAQAVLVSGMVAGALGMLLIILTEYVFPHGLYMRLSLTDKTARQIRIF
jgi:hypothetical protein